MNAWFGILIVVAGALLLVRYFWKAVFGLMKLALLLVLVAGSVVVVNEGVNGLVKFTPSTEQLAELAAAGKQASDLISQYELHVELRKRPQASLPEDHTSLWAQRRY